MAADGAIPASPAVAVEKPAGAASTTRTARATMPARIAIDRGEASVAGYPSGTAGPAEPTGAPQVLDGRALAADRHLDRRRDDVGRSNAPGRAGPAAAAAAVEHHARGSRREPHGAVLAER